MQFIVPAQTKLRTSPPLGDAWTHEIKFDGWRVQLHKHGPSVEIYTKSGYQCTRRFTSIAAAVALLPFHSCVIDGEVTACDEHGLPDFRALHLSKAHSSTLCVWAFDLLYLNG